MSTVPPEPSSHSEQSESESNHDTQPPPPTVSGEGASPEDLPTGFDATVPLIPSEDQPSARTVLPRFGDYELKAEIARGGMGVVYKARHVPTSRLVALKMILSRQFASERAIERFHIEARAAAQLDHPNIVPIYEIGDINGQHYFTMAYVEGGGLHHRLASSPIPPTMAAQILQQVSEAVQYAHEQGIIHRDIKPHNILLHSLGPGSTLDQTTPDSDLGKTLPPITPRLTDFGLAKVVASEGISVTGEALGTPGYMPPEQASGNSRQIGPRSDVYGLGAVLYHCLTGRPPYQAVSALETMQMALSSDPIPPSQLSPGVPADLENICLKCLSREPLHRYGTAGEVAEDLQAFLEGRPVKARAISRLERGWRWCRRNPVLAGLWLAVMLLLISGTSLSTFFAIRATESASQAKKEAIKATQAQGEAIELAEKEREQRERAEKLAIQEKALREQATTLAQKERAASETANRELYRAKVGSYALRLNMAQQHLRNGRPNLAKSILQLTERKLRGWEHDHLYHRCHRERTILRGHSQPVSCIALHPNGNLLLAGEGGALQTSSGVKLWDLKTQKCIAILEAHKSQIHAVAFDSTGNKALSSDNTGLIKIHDIPSKKTLRSFRAHRGPVLKAVFNHAGNRIITGGFDRTVRIFDASNGNELKVLKGHHSSVSSVAIAPDDQTIISGGSGRLGNLSGMVILWDAETGKIRKVLEDYRGRVSNIAIGPSGKQFLSGGLDNTIRLRETANGSTLFAIRNHQGGINDAVFSRNGKQFASVDGNGIIRIFDSATGAHRLSLPRHHPTTRICFAPDQRMISVGRQQTIAIQSSEPFLEPLNLKGLSSPVNGIAISPNGKLIASAGGQIVQRTSEVYLWSSQSGKRLQRLQGHTLPVIAVTFSPNGKYLATAGYDRTVRLWDIKTGKVLRVLEGFEQPVWSVAISPDSSLILSGSRNLLFSTGEIRLHKARTGQLLHHKTWKHSALSAVAFQANGTRFIGAGGSLQRGKIVLYETQSGKELATKDTLNGNISALALSPGGTTLALASANVTKKLYSLQFFNPNTLEPYRELTGHTGNIRSIRFDSSGLRMATGSDDRSVKIWDVRTGLELLTLRSHQGMVTAACFSPDDRILVTGSMDQSIKIWKSRRPPLIGDLQGHQLLVKAIAFFPNGNNLVSGSADKSVRVWSTRTEQQLHLLTGHTDSVLTVAVSPNGSLIASGSTDKTIRLWDAQTGKLLHTLTAHKLPVQCVAFSPDSRFLASGSLDATVRIWDVQTGKEVLLIPNNRAAVLCLAWVPNGNAIVTGDRGRTVRIRDAKTGREKKVLYRHLQSVISMDISPRGHLLVSGSNDRTIKILDLKAEKVLRRIPGLSRPILSVALVHEGQFLLSGSDDFVGINPELDLWDVQTGERITRLEGHTDTITAVAWSPRGKIAASASEDKTIKLWHLEDLLSPPK